VTSRRIVTTCVTTPSVRIGSFSVSVYTVLFAGCVISSVTSD